MAEAVLQLVYVGSVHTESKSHKHWTCVVCLFLFMPPFTIWVQGGSFRLSPKTAEHKSEQHWGSYIASCCTFCLSKFWLTSELCTSTMFLALCFERNACCLSGLVAAPLFILRAVWGRRPWWILMQSQSRVLDFWPWPLDMQKHASEVFKYLGCLLLHTKFRVLKTSLL